MKTATELGDEAAREGMRAARAAIEEVAPEVERVAGWIARYARSGYGAHVATRDSTLPADLRRWVEKGCPTR